ncbi:MAG: peroxiredoxin [Phycisphaeraceae bacterium]|nr:peroxiredoxin [Phycisphaeraceae bacterium]
MSLTVGKPAPDFKLEGVANGQFTSLGLEDFKGKWLVVFFYPLDFTFVCPTEILAFSDRIKEFKEAGAEVVGVSIDSKFTHLAWCNTPRAEGGIADLAYPLLADLNKTMSADYNVLTDVGVALRGLFIIDPEGVVQHATINNLSVGRNVDETLRVLRAFQFTAEHGEVCPADWTPGADSMKPDPAGSKEWFSKHH